MTTLQATETQNTEGFWLSGDYKYKDNETFLQEAGRVADLVSKTVVARRQSDLKLVPLTDLSPALVPGNMLCGAIGGTLPEFAAVSDAELSVDVNGETIELADMDLTGIDTIEDTPGYWLCGANGDVIGNWDALTDAAFSYVVDGVAYDTGQMNLTASVTFGGLIDIINFHLDGHATMEYAFTVDKFKLVSNKTGETSSVTIGAPAAGTDISAAGYLNQTAGAATAGTGGENLGENIAEIINAHAAGRFNVAFSGDAFVFMSPTSGILSAISVLSDPSAGGTYIGGAGFLNGETGTGTATVGTGQVSTSIPIGIFVGNDIATADLVAGDVEDQIVVNYGDPATFDVNKLILENSLDIDDVVVGTEKTIRQHLTEIGLIASDTDEIFQSNPLT